MNLLNAAQLQPKIRTGEDLLGPSIFIPIAKSYENGYVANRRGKNERPSP